MMSRYHTTNENKSYYHSSHKSKSEHRETNQVQSPTPKFWYNLAWSGPRHSDWHLCIKHHLDQIQGWFSATLGNKNGGQSKISKDANRNPTPPPQKKKRHFNKYIGPSQTATTYKKFQRLNLPMGGKGKDHFLLSSQAIFCPRVASWFLIDQSNKWDLKETYTYTF